MKLNTIRSYHRDVESRLWSMFYLLFCDETLKSNVCQRLSELAAFFVFQNEFLTPVFVYSSTPDQLVSCITFPVLLYSCIVLVYSCIRVFITLYQLLLLVNVQCSTGLALWVLKPLIKLQASM